ncbi:MAG: terminase small subunit [Methylococcales bacterium]
MENKKEDPISNALGISPLVTSNSVRDIISKAHDDSAKNDFEMARSNIHEVIQNGVVAMEKLSQIAESSQHPRAFEVLAKLMETMLQANKDLLALQKDIREIDAKDAPMNEQAKSVTNNLFVGSTADLQKAIENMKNGGNNNIS